MGIWELTLLARMLCSGHTHPADMAVAVSNPDGAITNSWGIRRPRLSHAALNGEEEVRLSRGRRLFCFQRSAPCVDAMSISTTSGLPPECPSLCCNATAAAADKRKNVQQGKRSSRKWGFYLPIEDAKDTESVCVKTAP